MESTRLGRQCDERAGKDFVTEKGKAGREVFHEEIGNVGIWTAYRITRFFHLV